MITEFFKKDSIWLGLAIGLILPVIVFFGFNAINLYSSRELFDKTQIISNSTSQLIALFGNVLVFRLYMIRWGKDYTGRGILMATFIYAFVFCYLNRSVLF